MSTALIIFAKAPIAGLAKTRLIPALGAQGAADLAEKLLKHAVSQALAARMDSVNLCVTPDMSHDVFKQLVKQSQGRLSLTLQAHGNLGERMDCALNMALEQHDRAILIGTDAPCLDASMLQAAALALANHDAVFIPALDGGYVLVGLTQAQPGIFADIPWSTAHVMAETRIRARRAGLQWLELEPVADVDEPRDLEHLPPGWLP